MQLTQNGTVSSITLYGGTVGEGKMIAAIYADNNGTPSTLIAQTPEIQTNGLAWYTFIFTTPVNLSAGYYWLCWIVPTGNPAMYKDYSSASTNNYWYYDPMSTTYPTLPADVTGKGTYEQATLAIYATYTPSS